MNFRFFYIFPFSFFFTDAAFAYSPCRDMQILWQLDDTTATIPPVTVKSSGGQDYFDITLPKLAPTSPGVVSWVQRFNVPENQSGVPSGNGTKNIATWIGVPKNNTNVYLGSGLWGRVEIVSGSYLKRGAYWGTQTYSGEYLYEDWVGTFPPNIRVGYKYPAVSNNFLPTTLRVYIDKGSAFAGTYFVQIPVKIGVEEWYKGESYCSGGAGVEERVSLMLDRFRDVQVNVEASCSLTNNNEISIKHGTITSTQARNGVSASATFGVKCSSPSTVKLTIENVEPVPGEGNNVTQCGTNGKCSLTIDDSPSFSGTIDGSKNFKISSSYQSIDRSKLSSGSFSGSAVLRVLMQ